MRTIEINLEAIAANYKILKSMSGAKVMAIVKADGFGHGMIEVARRLESINVDMLATADLDEAEQIRAAGIKSPLMAWLHGKNTDFAEAIENDIQIGLSTVQGLESVAAAAKKVSGCAGVHLKVDTGLGRNGAALADWPEVITKAVELEAAGLVKLIGVFSHLSGTSEKDDAEQLEVFEEAIATAQGLGANFEYRHLAASNATLNYKKTQLDMVRVGLALYGLDPNAATSAASFGLVPAMRVSSEVVSVKQVPAGHGVSYGYLHKTLEPTTLALVPFGYAEGMPRIATGKASVLLNGKRYPILARIAMDQFVLDVGNDSVKVGDEVVIVGDAKKGEPTAEELADAAGTINYEIVTRMGGRAKRVFR
ncbi:MAG: alanine racemase [Rhodoluna sp.]